MNIGAVIATLLFFLIITWLVIGSEQLKRYLLVDFLKGLGVTGRAFWRRKITQHYPDEGEELPISPRFKGALALRRYENGEERCIACKLCESICPALAITIEAEERADGARKTTRFDIDTFKCINCGLCEEACPVDSIVCTDEMHYSILQRGDNILAKDQLLMIGDMYEDRIQHNLREDNDG
ncbi:NADH-quinone oxidoreductase subunit NuoI [Candidatus Synchoanobacter obligatus]|uniref:NADH-quinone oxidoreductase subunit I n=1 Tax=Candidatus Synchoanobacter obligatus TaxID=2919597 RepID=A0ABT1L458_9GAMM|nr:NADH-quinone oxidoreductase subunit NuoI [Candidatus Synchoanobacter obligatus]MCP8351965.1 NADH-quinone oxidoreductase subunit NuoI [Candidatus Synchoanobacter obligatus]